MRLNYKRLGDYIETVKIRNTELKAKELLRININKHFMPSVANVVGTDLSKYKLVQKNQFACNRMHVGRDYRIPIAFSQRENLFMISPAYDVFEVTNTSELMPEYLMMWFSRAEFDRNAWFYTDADVRGGLAWQAFEDMQLPIPSIEKQREIVAEYNTIQNRIKLNEQLIQKLEETAQAIYREWFVEFEFPDETGKPYKSNGGEMIWNEELGKEIPKGWEVGNISDLGTIKHGFAFKGEDFTEDETSLLLVSPGNFKVRGGFNFERNKYYEGKYPKSYILSENDLIVNMTDLSKNGDTLGNTALIPIINFKTLLHNQRVGKFELISFLYTFYLYFVTNQKDYKHYILGTATGTTVRHTSPDRIAKFQIVIPKEEVINKFNLLISPIIKLINLSPAQSYKLSELKALLLSRLAGLEN
jgi:type I restriction enzyme S subunit